MFENLKLIVQILPLVFDIMKVVEQYIPETR